jgi:succinoglycan biosynthesis transport protein ExoP
MDSLSKRPGNEPREIELRPDNASVEPYAISYARPYPQPAPVDLGGADDFSVLLQYWGIVWRHKFVVLAFLAVGLLAAFIVSLYTTPMYRASATIEIQGIQEPFSNVVLNSTDPMLQTQADLLDSRTMRQRAVSKVFARNDPQVEVRPDPLSALRKKIGLPALKAAVNRQEAVDMASGNLEVIPSKQSRLIKIQTDSSHPQVAADFVNTLVEEFIQKNMEERWDAYQNTSDWLTRAQENLKSKLEKSEQDLVDFARQSGLVFTSESQNVTEEKLKQMQTELSKARVDRIARQSVYDSSLSSPGESLPEVLDNGPMAEYQKTLTQLRTELAQLTATLTPEHYRVKRLQAQINELEQARANERGNILKRIRIEYEAALRRETQLEKDYQAQTKLVTDQEEKLIHYNILKREVDLTRQLYETTLQKGKESSIASAMRASIARVVDPANPPALPYKPNVLTYSALGTFAGLGCGLLMVIVRERSDKSVGVPGALPHFLNVRELGVIPSAKTDPHARALARSKPQLLGPGSAPDKAGRSILMLDHDDQQHRRPSGLETVTWTRKVSVMADAYRGVMTSILFSGENGSRPGILVLTSPSPREGKSTVASNLGIALAEVGRRVLLIDGDMRLPRQHSIFDVANTWGLSDILLEKTPIVKYADELLFQKTIVPGLHILPSGPGRANVAGMLYSARVVELMNRLRRQFDMVLIDTAPVLIVPDSRILARASDAVVLVFRAGYTSHDSALAAARCFEEDGTRILGTVLNDWNPRAAGYGQYKSYHSHYYQNSDRS